MRFELLDGVRSMGTFGGVRQAKNAAGRLAGTLLSGVVYQWSGLVGTLWTAVALASVAGVVALMLPAARISVAEGATADE